MRILLGVGAAAALVVLALASASCDPVADLADYCERTRKCECTAGQCCAQATFECDEEMPCCGSLQCIAGRCIGGAPHGDGGAVDDGGVDGGGTEDDAGQADGGVDDAGSDAGPAGPTLTLTVRGVGGAGGAVLYASDECPVGSTCTWSTDGGTVALLAVPDGGGFRGWEGGGCSGAAPTCSLVLASDTAVTATFSAYNLVFVTHDKHADWATLTADPSIADARCNAAAQDAGLPGRYVAWVSSASESAGQRLFDAPTDAGRLGPPRGWVRVDGKPVADAIADLAPAEQSATDVNSYEYGGRMFHPIQVTERGQKLITRELVGTGTRMDGGIAAVCDGGLVTYGYAHTTTREWTASFSVSCTSNLRLYCFGTDYEVPLAFAPAPGRVAFLSRGGVRGGEGVNGMDALCQNEATARGLPGVFRAFVSDGTTPAAARFDGGTPWVRMDGVRIAPTAETLLSGGHLDAPINVTTEGLYVYSRVWTGATSPSIPGDAGESCEGWTRSDAGFLGRVGSGSDSSRYFDENRFTPANPNMLGTCQHVRPVYCLQE